MVLHAGIKKNAKRSELSGIKEPGQEDIGGKLAEDQGDPYGSFDLWRQRGSPNCIIRSTRQGCEAQHVGINLNYYDFGRVLIKLH
jgi:hypothetical protein